MSGSDVDPLRHEEVRSLLRAHVVAGRVVADLDGIRGLARENLRRARTVYPRGAEWLGEWQRLLDGPLVELLAVLTSASPRSRELRQNSPFAGVLSEEERERVDQTVHSLLGDPPPPPEVCHRWPLCPRDCPNPGCREVRAWMATVGDSGRRALEQFGNKHLLAAEHAAHDGRERP